MHRPRAATFLVFATILAVGACDDSPPSVFLPDAQPPDAGGDADMPDGDAGAGCRHDTQCEDGIDCTDDTCNTATGLCDHTANHERCYDESMCNGYEYCEPTLGCQPGIPYPGCNDHDACTVDLCQEPTGEQREPTCEHTAMDRDHDGHVDYHCPADPIGDPDGPRGDDCADLDPNRYPGAGEFCFDGLDNDCDADIDADDSDCLLQNDGCESATELVPGRRREGFTTGALGDVNTSCGWMGYADVVYTFTLEDDSDVTIDVLGRDFFYPFVAVQSECGDTTSEVRCLSSGTSIRFFERSMEAGTYFVVVESWMEGVFEILLDVAEPTEPPDGDDCTSPVLLHLGETTTVEMGDYSSNVPISCAGGTTYLDVVYAFALSERQDVRYEISAGGFTPYVAVSPLCGDLGSELACGGGTPQERSLCALAAGTYFVVVRGNREGDLDVTVTTSEPSEPPENEDCDSAIDISEGGVFPGTLLCSEADYDLSCEWFDNYDVAYTFTLDETSDASLRLSAEDGLTPSLAVLRECGPPASEVFCQRSSTVRALLRALEPGTYFVVISGEYQAAFELEASFGPPTTACDGATVVTESGTHRGNTSTDTDDFTSRCGGSGGADTVYEIRMETAFDLVAEVTAADFDTVLHLRRVCDDPASEVTCNDDSGGTLLSRIESRGLEAGTYYLIMDGLWSGAVGPYTLEIDLTPVE